MTRSSRRLLERRLIGAAAMYIESGHHIHRGMVFGLMMACELSEHSTVAQRRRSLKRWLAELKQKVPGSQDLVNDLEGNLKMFCVEAESNASLVDASAMAGDDGL